MRMLAGAVAAALLLAGCDSMNQREVATEAEVTATVTGVDRATRRIDLVTAGGEALSLTATPQMRNFDRIEPGDVATMQMYGSVSVRVADRSVPDERSTLGVIGRAPEGGRPGSVIGTVTTTTVTFVSYDPRTFEATILGPGGNPMVVAVQPGMRSFAAARTRGERVEVTISDAVALFVDRPAS